MSFQPQFIILAQEGGAAPAPAGTGSPAAPAPGGMGGMLVPMVLMMVIFYFILIRPQRKQQKELEAKRGALQIGDDVITLGGIHGKVTNKTDRTVTVKVADNTKIKFEKSAISQVFPSGKGVPAEIEAEVEVLPPAEKA